VAPTIEGALPKIFGAPWQAHTRMSEMATRPFQWAGEVTKLTGATFDITELKIEKIVRSGA
jgi:hypothetical protein